MKFGHSCYEQNESMVRIPLIRRRTARLPEGRQQASKLRRMDALLRAAAASGKSI
jgi:hypothetical protein